MKIHILGAAGGEVTGSAYLVETSKARVLVDCGLFQGGRRTERLNRPPLRRGARLDAVLLTHGHLDHTGRLPLLAQIGYKGPVLTTPASIEMTGLILRDAARLQASDTERQNRRLRRAGKPPVAPLYTSEEAEQILKQLRPVSYRETTPVAPGIEAQWAEAGHILGSTSIQLMIRDGDTTRRVVFSGDLGPKGAPILRDYEPFHTADAVFLESTYGDRDHRPFKDTVAEFIAIVRGAIESGGKILVPTFAVGRAQLIVGLLGWIFRNKHIAPFPVFLDSPMAIEASRIYAGHQELFDEEMVAFLREKPLREDLRTLRLCATADQSRNINDQPGPLLVLAGSGMCNGGRILHHFKHNLWKAGTHVLIVGFQSQGSLGRRLVAGDPFVVIYGEKIAVRAQVHTLNGFSAHAGQTDLLAWFDSIAPCRPRVFLTHGEDTPRSALARLIRERHGIEAVLPALNETVEI